MHSSRAACVLGEARVTVDRSEEHTSELQSQSNLVCRLLLEKKKVHLPDAAMTWSQRLGTTCSPGPVERSLWSRGDSPLYTRNATPPTHRVFRSLCDPLAYCSPTESMCHNLRG